MAADSAPKDIVREVAIRSGLSELFRENSVREACRRGGVMSPEPTPQEMQRVLPGLARSLRVFLGADEAAKRIADIEEYLRQQRAMDPVEPITLRIKREADVGLARATVRDLGTRLGANQLNLQRACTIASEVTRNMVSYAGGGELTVLVVDGQPRRALQIVARDSGPGIPNLQAILAGQYRSRTGLGLGILGTKRLADQFHIETGPKGTLIRAEIAL